MPNRFTPQFINTGATLGSRAPRGVDPLEQQRLDQENALKQQELDQIRALQEAQIGQADAQRAQALFTLSQQQERAANLQRRQGSQAFPGGQAGINTFAAQQNARVSPDPREVEAGLQAINTQPQQPVQQGQSFEQRFPTATGRFGASFGALAQDPTILTDAIPGSETIGNFFGGLSRGIQDEPTINTGPVQPIQPQQTIQDAPIGGQQQGIQVAQQAIQGGVPQNVIEAMFESAQFNDINGNPNAYDNITKLLELQSEMQQATADRQGRMDLGMAQLFEQRVRAIMENEARFNQSLLANLDSVVQQTTEGMLRGSSPLGRSGAAGQLPGLGGSQIQSIEEIR